MTEEAQRVARRGYGVYWLISALLMSIVVLAVALGIVFFRYRQVADKQPPSDVVQANKLVAALGQTIALPNEQASIATVADKTKLGNTQLARSAQNGDQLLVFSEARRVILYRPSAKKVIDMFHITAEQTEAVTE